MSSRNSNIEKVLVLARSIRLLCLDVDGVLTDGIMYYDSHGEAMKAFHTRDAAGIALVRKAGIEVALISAEDSPITAARAKKLNISHTVLGCDDKVLAVEALRGQMELKWEEIAYMGDDWFDIPLLQRSGLSACPRNAHPQVEKIVCYRSHFDGGRGAVRDFCDILLAAHTPEIQDQLS